MAEELPILKGILKGNFSYHNARKCKQVIHIIALFHTHSILTMRMTNNNNKYYVDVIEKKAINQSALIDWWCSFYWMNHGRSLVDWSHQLIDSHLFIIICCNDNSTNDNNNTNVVWASERASVRTCVCYGVIVKCMLWCLFVTHAYSYREIAMNQPLKWLWVQCWSKILFFTFKAIPSEK